MSTTVDQRVVEMEFDNSNFESNVKTSMSTIEKLKNALDFSGACGGLEDLNSSIGNVDMGVLGNAVNSVSKSFSALEIVAITALVNITNQAISAGEQLVSSLTVDQVASGWEKFSENTKNIGTLVAQGFDLSTVEEQLDKLLWYTDETSYNYSDMVTTISKFTASGMGLEDSVTAMMGIANAAALSGQNATTASSSMYQLAQAMSVGYIKLSDWQQAFSNKNMDTTTLRQQCLDAAVQLETLIEVSEGVYETLKGNTVTLTDFTSNLTSDAWLTADVMMEVFENYANAVDAIYEYTEETGCTASEAIEELADSLDDFGVTAFEAAQQARTFEDVVDSVKDAASTAWLTIFNSIFGDYEETVERWTALANKLYYMFVQPIYDWWESFDNALSNSPLGSFIDTITELTSSTSEAAATVEEVASAIEDVSDVVNAVIRGEWGRGQTRWDALTEAGYDWAYVQNLVNEQLGCSVRHETSYTEATEDVAEAVAYTADQLAALSDAELTELGLEEDEIKSLRTYAAAAEAAGMSLADFLDSMDDMTGREMLWQGLQNVATAVLNVFGAIGDAWSEVFPASSSEAIYNAIKAFYTWSETLKDNATAVSKLTRTFKGLFSILKIIKSTIKEVIKAGLKVLNNVLGSVNIDILEVTASVGDAIVAFEEWLVGSGRLSAAIQNVADWLITGIDTVKKYIKAFLNLPRVQKVIENFKNKISELKDVAKSVFENLKEGLEDGSLTLFSAIAIIGTGMLNAIKTVLGIHSPSTEGYTIGVNFIQGIINGVKYMVELLLSTITGVGSSISEVLTNLVSNFTTTISENFGDVDITQLASFASLVSLFYFIKKLATAMDTLSNPVQGATKVLTSISTAIKSFAKNLKAAAFEKKTSGIKNIAIAIAILAATIIALTYVDTDKLLVAVGVIALLTIVLGALAFFMSLLSKKAVTISKDSVTLDTSIPKILAIAAAMLLLAGAIRIIGSMEPAQLALGIFGIVALFGAMIALVVAYGLFAKNMTGSKIGLLGVAMMALAAALLLMVAAIAIIGMMSIETIAKGVAVILIFSFFVTSFMLIAALLPAGALVGVGASMLALSAALILTIVAVKLAGSLSVSDILKGVVFMAVFAVFIAALIAIGSGGIGGTGLAVPGSSSTSQLTAVAGTLLALSVAMLLLVAVTKIVGTLTIGDMVKGIIFMSLFLVFLNYMVKILSKNTELAKVGLTLVLVAGAINLLVYSVVALSLLDLAAMGKGLVVVGFLSAFLAGIIAVSKFAGNCKGTLALVGVIIAELALCVFLLSLVDAEKLAKPLAAMLAMMGMLALVLAAASLVKPSVKTIFALIVVAGLIAEMALVLYMLQKHGSSSAMLAAAKAMAIMSVVVVAIAALMVVLAGCTVTVGPALLGVLAVSAILVELGLLLTLIGTVYEYIGAAEKIKVVGEVLAAIGAAIGNFVGGLIGGVLEGITSTLPQVGQNLSEFAENAAEFTDFMADKGGDLLDGIIKLCEAILVVTGTDILTTIASFVTGGHSFSTFASTLASVGPDFYQFYDDTKDVDAKQVKESAEALVILAEAAASIPNSGGLISLIVGDNSLSDFGTAIKQLGENLRSYYLRAHLIEIEPFEVGAEAITVFAEAADKIPAQGGFFSLFSGNSTLKKFGEVLDDLAPHLSNYCANATGIRLTLLTNGAEAITAFAEAADKIPAQGGFFSLFSGNSTLKKFGEVLDDLAPHLSNYCSNATGIRLSLFETGANAITVFAEAASALPETGGFKQWFCGGVDLESFASNLESLGSGLTEFISSAAGWRQSYFDVGAHAISVLAEAADGISTTGGFVQAFCGGIDIGAFGENIKSLGGHLNYFHSVAGDWKPEPFEVGAHAISVLAEAADGISTTGGFVQAFCGGIDIGTFGENIKSLGGSLTHFHSLAEDWKPEPFEVGAHAISVLAEAADGISTTGGFVSMLCGDKSLADFASNINAMAGNMNSFFNKAKEWYPEPFEVGAHAIKVFSEVSVPSDVSKYGKLADGLLELGPGLKKYYDSVANVNQEAGVNSLIMLKDLVSIMDDFSDSDSAAIKDFCESLKNLANKGILGFTTAFSEADETVAAAMEDFVTDCTSTLNGLSPQYEDVATAIISSFINGIMTKLDDAVTSIRNFYDDFKKAGKYLVEGFADGISKNTYLATAKAKAMAKAAAEAAAKELDEHSPSKVGYQIGDYFGIGFVNAIADSAEDAADASSDMANAASTGLSNALSGITDLLDSDMDTQPTIRPVLDLSNIETGMTTLSTMFGAEQAISASVGVDRVRNQNAENASLTSSMMDKLAKLSANSTGETFTFNNTFEVNGGGDAKEIAEQVSTIIQRQINRKGAAWR